MDETLSGIVMISCMGCFVNNVLIEILDFIKNLLILFGLSGHDITNGIILYTKCDHTLIDSYIVVARKKLLIGSAVCNN